MNTEEELENQNDPAQAREEAQAIQVKLDAAVGTIDQLKEQLARAMTDNEVLTEQNAKLHDEAETARVQAQELGNLNSLLISKSQRLEQDLVASGKQTDQYRKGFEKYGRQIAELTDRLSRQKLLDKEPPTVLRT